MTTYKRGDIVLAYFPFTDLETVKQRPALIVQADSLVTDFTDEIVIIAQITSMMKRARYPTRVSLLLSEPLSKGTGLLTDSVIVADLLMTIQIKNISKKIGEMADMTAIDRALRNALGV
jgi:mRNA interferase MazF